MPNPVTEPVRSTAGDSPQGSSGEASLATCPECKQQNPTSRRFCAACGRNLWEKCPQCNQEHLEGEAYCGHCGANIQQLYKQREQRIRTTFEESHTLAARHEFDLAITRLRSIATLENRRYRQLVEEANAAIERFKAERQAAVDAAEQAVQEAGSLLRASEYHQTVAVLEAVPEPLRQGAAATLLKQARSKRDAVDGLNAEIREAVRSNELQGLCTRLERLLDLKPGDEQALRLARQMRDRLVRSARKKLQEEDYASAIRLLDEVPTCALNDDVQGLVSQARELDWLMTNLKLAAVVDQTLLTLADRLVQLRPKNQEAARLHQKLKARSAAAPPSAAQAAPDWAVPRTPYLGCPAEWPAGLRRIACSDDVARSFRTQPGRFFVACGLALQALNAASITADLLSSERQASVLDKLRLRRKRTPQAAWGLDLGTHSLKAVRMSRGDSDEPLSIDACVLIDHAIAVRPEEDQSATREVVVKSLEQFFSGHVLDGEKVCVNLPGAMVLGRFFDLPLVEEKQIDQAVRFQAAAQLPFALEDLHWGYQVFELADEASAEMRTSRVVLQAVKSHHVRELLLTCEAAGFKPDYVQSDCAALHNLVAHEYLGSDIEPDDAVAILDVGANGSNLVISSSHSCWFRNIGIGGETFTSALLRPFKLTRDQAERLKRKPSAAKRVSAVYEALTPTLTHLVEEVQRSLKVHHKLYPELTVRRILGGGGGFAIHGLLRRLRTGH